MGSEMCIRDRSWVQVWSVNFAGAAKAAVVKRHTITNKQHQNTSAAPNFEAVYKMLRKTV